MSFPSPKLLVHFCSRLHLFFMLLFLSIEKLGYSSAEVHSVWILVNCIHVVLVAMFPWFLIPSYFPRVLEALCFLHSACLCLANGWHVALPQEVMFIGDFLCTETLIRIHELKRDYTMVIISFCCSLFIYL